VMKEFQKQKDFWLCSFKCKISDEKSWSAVFLSYKIGWHLQIKHKDNTISLVGIKKKRSTLSTTLRDINSPTHSHSHTNSHKRTDTQTATHTYIDTYTHSHNQTHMITTHSHTHSHILTHGQPHT
jgi:hypothetical protein